MSVLKNPLFIICCIAFWVNQAIERAWEIYIPWVHAYLDDLLAMPVIFGITLQIFRWIHPLKAKFRFSKKQLIIGWIYFSLIFEVFLPSRSDIYTADPWDVVCYGIGTIAFYIFINNPSITEK
ncbi:magnesium citrate secondary transporter [Belliella kenyensis]|uniref:Magnesium citrate secondary transporter n=1 Tax=Belliella kenyensis TaxID=1472724 RepID=A0ABV8EQW0_9BACT|nr:magnesium citrate secondary transporter [Belliella kenyensis]MCH7401469.1 magnesium citrate secondary transporter [Belliella kenyensis]MDN3603250.1 magnesium citrate secondary transporter [Belliella kenyensis]